MAEEVLMAEKEYVDEKELEKAEEEAEELRSSSSYTHRLKEPFEYEGKTYTELTFDWGKLTGNDTLKIEEEMMQMNLPLIAPEFSGQYLVRMASKACTVPIGADVISALPIKDFNRIRSRARSFLLAADL